MGDFTSHQKKIIERYYDHRDEISLTKLGEIVTELYLADSDGKRKRLWSRAARAMKTLQIPPDVANHIVTQGKPEVLAENLRGWLAKPKPSSSGGRKEGVKKRPT